MAAFAVAVATGDIIKYQSFVYGSFVWGIHVRYNNRVYQSVNALDIHMVIIEVEEMITSSEFILTVKCFPTFFSIEGNNKIRGDPKIWTSLGESMQKIKLTVNQWL